MVKSMTLPSSAKILESPGEKSYSCRHYYIWDIFCFSIFSSPEPKAPGELLVC